MPFKHVREIVSVHLLDEFCVGVYISMVLVVLVAVKAIYVSEISEGVCMMHVCIVCIIMQALIVRISGIGIIVNAVGNSSYCRILPCSVEL